MLSRDPIPSQRLLGRPGQWGPASIPHRSPRKFLQASDTLNTLSAKPGAAAAQLRKLSNSRRGHFCLLKFHCQHPAHTFLTRRSQVMIRQSALGRTMLKRPTTKAMPERNLSVSMRLWRTMIGRSLLARTMARRSTTPATRLGRSSYRRGAGAYDKTLRPIRAGVPCSTIMSPGFIPSW
jgi:hypothetical protein